MHQTAYQAVNQDPAPRSELNQSSNSAAIAKLRRCAAVRLSPRQQASEPKSRNRPFFRGRNDRRSRNPWIIAARRLELASDARAKPCYARSRGRQNGKRNAAAAPRTRCSARPIRAAIAVRCPAFRPTRRAVLRTTGRRKAFRRPGVKRGHGHLPPGERHPPAARSRHRAEIDPRLLAALHGADHAARGRRSNSAISGRCSRGAAPPPGRLGADLPRLSGMRPVARKGLNAKAVVAGLALPAGLDPVLGRSTITSSTSTRRSTRATMPA